MIHNSFQRSVLAGITGLLVVPQITLAQLATSGDGGPFEQLLINILDFTNDILIPFILGIGFLFFVWGMFRYFIMGGANEDAKEQGKSLLVSATIAFVVIIVFWGIINLLAGSTGLVDQELQSIPTIDELIE